MGHQKQPRSTVEQVQLRTVEDDRRCNVLLPPEFGQGGGIDPKYVHDMHRRMDEAYDLDGVNAEIARLRRRLEQLGGSPE